MNEHKEVEYAIGIDLGTVTCNLAVVNKFEKIDIIPCKQTGEECMPSIVSFTNTDRLIFHAAKRKMKENLKNTVFEAKRLIGRCFDSPLIKQDKMKPYKIFNCEGKPKIEVQFKNKVEEFHIEHIMAILLAGLREMAEGFLDAVVKKVVITVPATFTNGQRQATMDAGKVAGLEVLRIIHEPIAAAIAYDHIHGIETNKNILIYDLGGGTFDVSIVRKTDCKTFEVIGNAGDGHLGGVDFDHILVDYVRGEFLKTSGVSIPNNDVKNHLLRTECEQMKCTLSEVTEYDLCIGNIVNEHDLKLKITRIKFEEIICEKLMRTIKIIQGCLSDGKMDASSIHKVIVVGGSSKIPKVKEILEEVFSSEQIFIPDKPFIYVAMGAALQANSLKDGSCEKIIVLERANDSIGLETEGEKMDILIPRNHEIPCSIKKLYYNLRDNQRTIEIEVYEGEEEQTEDNMRLGMFELTGITPNTAYSEEIEVNFEIDNNGLLQVTARDMRKPSNSNSIKINVDKGRLSSEELEELILYERRVFENNKIAKRRDIVKSQLESTISDLEDIPRAKKACSEAQDWLDDNPGATIAEIEQQIEKLDKFQT